MGLMIGASNRKANGVSDTTEGLGDSAMRRVFVGIALVGLIALALPLAASGQYREFNGRIDQISKKKMIVDNRMGDKVSFVPGSPSKVTGEGRTAWSNLKRNDWVTVSWKMVDKPRVAYVVKVLPPVKEAGEDD